MTDRRGHLRCPYCDAYEVDRLYLGTLRLDSCHCRSCEHRWDEEPESGQCEEPLLPTSTLSSGRV